MNPNRQIASTDLNVPSDQAYRKSIQRLRWFRSTFEEQIESIELRTGIEYKLDPKVLTECFLDWIRHFEAAKPNVPKHRVAYVGFAAGQMLKELLLKKPLTVISMPKLIDEELPEYFWPEGFVYVTYCLNVRQAVLKKDFGVEIEQASALEELRTWWSFKENVAEDPNYAISFLDLFAGETPNWQFSGLFNGKARSEQLEKVITGQLPSA